MPSCDLARWASQWIQGNWCLGFTQNLYSDQGLLGREWWVTGASPSAVWKALPCPGCLQREESFTLNLSTHLTQWDWSTIFLNPTGSLVRERVPGPVHRYVFSFSPCLSLHHRHESSMGCTQGCTKKMSFTNLSTPSKRSPLVYVSTFSQIYAHCSTFQNVTQSLLVLLSTSSP